MNLGGIRSAIFEARALAGELDGELARPVGPMVVSGMLGEQLARQLGTEAERGAVVVDGESRLPTASVVVHVIAGEPSPADRALVARADRHGVPVVLVQLWPQDDWTVPFVLTPFVVECEAGKGFPIGEIARRIADAVEDAPALARRVPVLQEQVTGRLVVASVVKSALLGAGRSTRPALALEQVRLATQLRAAQGDREIADTRVATGVGAAAVAASFALRAVARSAGRVLPSPVVDVALAVATTWALGEALRRFETAPR